MTADRGSRRRRLGRAAGEFDRREELVRAVVWLRRGQIEDLEVLMRHARRRATRSEVVREAVGWLLAREAMRLVRGRDVDARKAEDARREAEAIAHTRAERDVVDQEDELEQALSIAQKADG